MNSLEHYAKEFELYYEGNWKTVKVFVCISDMNSCFRKICGLECGADGKTEAERES